jgi:hypothetical protein
MRQDMDILVRQAIEAAEQRHPNGVWFGMAPREQVAAIYDELRRLDGEISKTLTPVPWERRRRLRRSADGTSTPRPRRSLN